MYRVIEIRYNKFRKLEEWKKEDKFVVEDLKAMKFKWAAKKLEDGIEETLTHMNFPYEHWTRIRTNNAIERVNREIRRRTRVVGTFPDDASALMFVCARLRHVAGTQLGSKKYINMKHLENLGSSESDFITG
ncbi:MAG: transposase [Clostridia bacterium]|nr:transposase [Clostridia bacterium]